MKNKEIILILILIVALGAFLRFYEIGKQSFWLDESATALSIKKYSFGETFYNTLILGQILPGYYISNLDLPPYFTILKIWSDVFGINESPLRAFSAVFGVLSVITLYFLAKELFNRKTAIIAALIFSLNVVMIEYSQEARLYSMLIFIVIVSAYFLIKSIKTNENKHIAGFVISNIAGIYTHYPFLFFVIFELLFVFILFVKEYLKSKKIEINKIRIAALSLILFYLPLAPRILRPKLVAAHYLGRISVQNVVKLFLQLNTWFYPSMELRNKMDTLQFSSFLFSDWILVISVILLTILLFAFVLRNFIGTKGFKKTDNSKLLLALWIVIPSIVALAVLYKSILTFGSLKHFIFVVPPYLILAANGVYDLKGKKLYISVILLCLLSVARLVSYYSNRSKPRYREAVRFLELNSDNKELIMVNLPSVIVPFDYYSDRLNVNRVLDANEAAKLSAGYSSAWIVLSTKYADSNIKSYFDKNYKLSESKIFFDVHIYHYTKK